MKTNRMKISLISLLLVAMFAQLAFLSMNTIEVKAFKGEIPRVIFDIGHDQYFNDTHMASALNYIEEAYDATVEMNEGNFTFTTFRGADLVILTAPYYGIETSGYYSDLEKLALKEYIQDGGAVLFLANPYFYELTMRNYSSNNLALNTLLFSDIASLNLIQGRRALLNDFDYKYNDQRFIYLQNISFLQDHPIISGRNARVVNELLTSATFISSISGGDRIINTTYTTYQLDYENVPLGSIPTGGVGSQTILMSEEISKCRLVTCGSAIMFSDLEIPGANSTWYEIYDNALLWQNIVDWLFFLSPVYVEPSILPPMIVFVLGILGVFLVLVVFGIIFYVAGKEVKRAEVSETIIKMRERDAKKEKEDEELFGEELYAEDEVEEIREEPKPKKVAVPKEVDMKTISDEVKQKPPKARSRSERRRSR